MRNYGVNTHSVPQSSHKYMAENKEIKNFDLKVIS